MRLTEWQGKQLLGMVNIPIPRGTLAKSPAEVEKFAASYPDGVTIKAQVLAPGRGLHGGVRFAESAVGAAEVTSAILGTSIQGEVASSVLVEERLPILAEFYLALRINTSQRRIDIIASQLGGNGIEERARAYPEQFVTVFHQRNKPFFSFEARSLAARLRLKGQTLLDFASLVVRAYEAFCRFEARLLEINPVALLADGQMVALDAIALLDDDALYRLKFLEEIGISKGEEKLRPPTEREQLAASIDREDYRGAVHYVDLDPNGEVGVISVGSGFSIALMDMLDTFHLTQANFCDCSGNPSAEKVKKATQLVLSIPSVCGFLFASGVVSQPLDVTAAGIIAAFVETPPSVPVVIRLAGDRDREGCKMLHAAGITNAYTRERDMEDCIAELYDLMHAVRENH
jgi:succinyl-CoA synthetase beta subunit